MNLKNRCSNSMNRPQIPRNINCSKNNAKPSQPRVSLAVQHSSLSNKHTKNSLNQRSTQFTCVALLCVQTFGDFYLCMIREDLATLQRALNNPNPNISATENTEAGHPLKHDNDSTKRNCSYPIRILVWLLSVIRVDVLLVGGTAQMTMMMMPS